jgi:glutamate-1-semialdehyde 2,1-aminomutase
MLPEGNQIEDEFLSLLSELVDFPIGGVGFQTSGSSGVHRAVRLARIATGRHKIAVIGKFWHGSDDQFLFEGEGYTQISKGIPGSFQSESIYFTSLDEFLKAKNLSEFAGLLVEPYQGSDPSNSTLESSLSNWREILKKNGILLICDEIINGFRACYGSTPISRKSNPDIVIFGKAICLGFPIGLVIVKKEIHQRILGEEKYFWGGTFSASPIQLQLMYTSLKKLKNLEFQILETNLISIIEKIEDILRNNNVIIKKGFGFARLIFNENGSIKSSSRGFLDDNKNRIDDLRNTLMENNIFIHHNLLIFPSVYNINKVGKK